MTIYWKAVEQCFTLFFNFSQFVILENLSVLDLALSEVKGLMIGFEWRFLVDKVEMR